MNFAISEENGLLTKKEAAAKLRVTVRTVDRYMADGTLTAVRLSTRATRITRESLDALLSPATPTVPAADTSPQESAVGASSVSVPSAPEAPGPDLLREAS